MTGNSEAIASELSVMITAFSNFETFPYREQNRLGNYFVTYDLT